MNKAEKTRQLIIEQAASIFNEKGIAGTSIDDVLKASRVAKGCLYGHFTSKEELAHASVDYMLCKISDRRNSLLEKQTTAKGKLFAFIDQSKNPLAPVIDGGCPIMNLGAESDDTNPVIRKKIRTAIDSSLKTLTAILGEGIKTGEFSPELDAEDFAIKIFTGLQGANAICRVLNSTRPMQVIIKGLKAELNTYTCCQQTTIPVNG